MIGQNAQMMDKHRLIHLDVPWTNVYAFRVSELGDDTCVPVDHAIPIT